MRSRRSKHAAHENHERWLVSYADFITLLFAFFVVMFATSQADKDKQETVSVAVKEALEQGTLVTTIAGFLGKSKDNQDIHLPDAKPYQGARQEPKSKPTKQTSDTPTPQEAAAQAAVVELLPSLKTLSAELEKEVASGKLDISLEPRGLVVSLREAAFFRPADARINPDAYEIIERVAESIKKLPNPVRMEGHTDSTPIRKGRFRSNWELSAARSIAMLDLLADEFEIPREKMAIAGYADTAPIDSNETPAGRARNRRVDIIILNQFGLTNEPKKFHHASPAKPAKPSPFDPAKSTE